MKTKKNKNPLVATSAASIAVVHFGGVVQPGLAAIVVFLILTSKSRRAMRELLNGLVNLPKELNQDCIILIPALKL